MKKRMISLASLIAVSVSLVACSGGSNVLLTADLQDTAWFLVKAESYAEDHTPLDGYMGSPYEECINTPGHYEQESGRNLCDEFFEAMRTYAKTTQGPFRHVSVNNLKDLAVMKRMGGLISYMRRLPDNAPQLTAQELKEHQAHEYNG